MNLSPIVEELLGQLAQQGRNDKNDPVVRLALRARAQDACEYCLMPTVGVFHVDHVIPPVLWSDYLAGRLPDVQLQSGRRGPDHVDNFAWSCPLCNQAKKAQAVHRVGQRQQRLFDPRRDRWPDHFLFVHDYLLIKGASDVGKATELALKLNDPRLDGHLAERHKAVLTRRYPPLWAVSWSAD